MMKVIVHQKSLFLLFKECPSYIFEIKITNFFHIVSWKISRNIGTWIEIFYYYYFCLKQSILISRIFDETDSLFWAEDEWSSSESKIKLSGKRKRRRSIAYRNQVKVHRSRSALFQSSSSHSSSNCLKLSAKNNFSNCKSLYKMNFYLFISYKKLIVENLIK